MMKSDKKPAIAILIGGPKREKPEPEGDKPEAEGTDDQMSGDEKRREAVKALFSAYRTNNVEAGMSALDAFIACGPQDEEETDDEAMDDEAEGEEPRKRGRY